MGTKCFHEVVYLHVKSKEIKFISFLINLHTGPREDDANPEFNVNSRTDENGSVFPGSLSHKNPKSPVFGA